MVTSTLVPAEQSRPTPAEASLGLAMAYRLLGQAFRYPDRADAVLRLVDELGDSLAVICEDPPAGASAGTDRGDASLRLSMTGGVCDDPPAGPAAGTPEGDASLRLSMTGEDSRPP
ncbi:MAG: hypothetical protein HY331_09110, partial [Chloroflexi bacterium]|nr:hypothetical protein [Chloroflexota bacterium]